MKKIEAYVVRSDKTLMTYSKKDLISIIRNLEDAYKGHIETNDRQYNMLTTLLAGLLKIGYTYEDIKKISDCAMYDDKQEDEEIIVAV